MINEMLSQYGILGIWTIYNLLTIQYYRIQEREEKTDLKRVIENNTIALTKNYENINFCKIKNNLK